MCIALEFNIFVAGLALCLSFFTDRVAEKMVQILLWFSFLASFCYVCLLPFLPG